ncbi:hypothetical protein E0485_05695 [Paenibacillus albiflavus]|uniref:Uncharacterized protein n=1 Tax=Paenibacillus albiflavus TaxID=2545760 RepID=A0A4R4EIX7_9BACL|nr:hypothetical protein [Paenibacillus albiflavus]TCZ79353.1 hypothetical protein E0485_05695 [Paenibacillus albiflavus]
MIKAKKILYAVAVFIVSLILIQALINAVVSSMISDNYLKSWISLLLSVGIAIFFTIVALNKSNQKKL